MNQLARREKMVEGLWISDLTCYYSTRNTGHSISRVISHWSEWRVDRPYNSRAIIHWGFVYYPDGELTNNETTESINAIAGCPLHSLVPLPAALANPQAFSECHGTPVALPLKLATGMFSGRFFGSVPTVSAIEKNLLVSTWKACESLIKYINSSLISESMSNWTITFQKGANRSTSHVIISYMNYYQFYRIKSN